jgi:sigma-B regulation protein RsbU (phosphoserine phosphatase)
MNANPISVLIVDDDPVFALLVEQIVSSLGAELPCAVRCAASAEAGWTEIRNHRFDAALVDYHLPAGSGLDLLGQIRTLPLERQPAVIMLTGDGNAAVAVEAMKRGAKDYLQKSQVEVPALLHALQSALAQKRLAEQVAAYHAQIQADLDLAHKLQESLLPRSYPAFPRTGPATQSALRFEHRYFWTTQLGGDFFSVQSLSDSRAGVLICDVMGHGVRSALVTAMLRAMVGDLEAYAEEPGRFLSEMNRRLATILKQIAEPLFATAFYLVADVATGQMRYASAGHPLPLHLRRTAGDVAPLPVAKPAGAALGLFEQTAYATAEGPLTAGDALLFFTDGLLEAANPAAEDFGAARLLAATRERVQLPLPELLDALIAAVRRFADGAEFTDDVCLLGMEVARIGARS